ncbi:MAG: hypothetical protein Q9162_002788 [Coniocarpon cinnabarinum]
MAIVAAIVLIQSGIFLQWRLRKLYGKVQDWLTQDERNDSESRRRRMFERAVGAIRKYDPHRIWVGFERWLLRLFQKDRMAELLSQAEEGAARRSEVSLRDHGSISDISAEELQTLPFPRTQAPDSLERTSNLGRKEGNESHSERSAFSSHSSRLIASSDSNGNMYFDEAFSEKENEKNQARYTEALENMSKKKSKQKLREAALILDGTLERERVPSLSRPTTKPTEPQFSEIRTSGSVSREDAASTHSDEDHA